ncbi:MAG: hypothetical protein ACE5H8_16045 [Alphaproteobacteria bacterium]
MRDPITYSVDCGARSVEHTIPRDSEARHAVNMFMHALANAGIRFTDEDRAEFRARAIGFRLADPTEGWAARNERMARHMRPFIAARRERV